jgi:histidine triad (HIT) family protein
MDCLFCRIVNKEIPAEIVYENGRSLAFLSINPINSGHALVIPKAHHADFASTPPELLGDIASVAQKVARAVTASLGAPGFNIGVNNGRAAGQLVDHMHLHVIPRFTDDRHEHWHAKHYGDGEMAKVAAGIRESLTRSTS